MGTGDLAVPIALMQRMNFPYLRLLAQRAPPNKRDEGLINGGVDELFFRRDGKQTKLLNYLLNQPNPADGGKAYAVVWDEFLAVVQSRVRRILVDLLKFAPADADKYVFGGTLSALCRTGKGKAQAPHVEIVYGGLQFLVAGTSGCVPANVFCYSSAFPAERSAAEELEAVRLHHEAVARSPEEEAAWQPLDSQEMIAAKLPLSWGREELLSCMMPAFGRSLLLGEIVVLVGPVIHGGPECVLSSLERIVFFGTAHLPGTDTHDADYQQLPWVHLTRMGGADAFIRAMKEWRDHSPEAGWRAHTVVLGGQTETLETVATQLMDGPPAQARALFHAHLEDKA